MKRTGGVRIGWYHASWPLATLYADSNEIRLKVFLAEEYRFEKGQVSGIEIVGSVPLISQGIKIGHIVPDYPEKIIFYGGNPEKLIKAIHDAGFRPAATAASAPRRDGIPVRWQAIILIIALWNTPFLIEGGFKPESNPSKMRPHQLIALMTFFLASIALQRSQYLQSLMLKPGRRMGEIRHIVSLITLITGFLSIIFGLFYILGKN